MQNPRDLRDKARQWRRQAIAHAPGAAKALMLAAELLELKADRIEAAAPAQPASLIDATGWSASSAPLEALHDPI